jgi:hypothetical protein
MANGTRCSLHGGASLAAKIKSEQMLAQARLPACEALYEIIETWSRKECALCGHPSGDTDMQRTIIRAAQVILDRTGMGPHAVLEITRQADGDLNLDMMSDAERSEFAAITSQFKALKQRVKQRLGMMPMLKVTAALPPSDDPIIIDGETV